MGVLRRRPTTSLPLPSAVAAAAAAALAALAAASVATPAATAAPPALGAPPAHGAPAAAASPQLRVGVGRADITPVTGIYRGGWACACAKGLGQLTRLYARVVVLQVGARKLALVSEDLAFLSAGMIRDATALLPGLGFSEQNVIDSATHTHGSQAGFMNFPAYNSILPSTGNPTLSGLAATATDPVMYDFMTRQLALAIDRANANLGPGALGWGATRLLGVTENRSLEAHLANYGIIEPPGTGNVNQDPGGYAGTIDPVVNVLRVDKLRHGKRVPVGMWSTFANHGTVIKAIFPYLSADHQAAAEREVEATIRGEGGAPTGQDVVNAFANSDAGDVTSGIEHSGPADAEWVGQREAAAMLAAWRAAGRSMNRHPQLRYMWTRTCFCGQHMSDSTPVLGFAQGAGSEEGRTIFYDLGIAREGQMLPFDLGPQGDKVPAPIPEQGNVPQAVPFTVAQIGDRLLATVPGEPTVGAGKLLRDAVAAAVSGSGIHRVVIVGYVGEYLDYFTTPAEYERQHYEGGSTLYGHYATLVLRDSLTNLAQRLVAGLPAPTPYPFDPNHGVHVGVVNYGPGSDRGSATTQPAAVRRLQRATFSWKGGPNGIDRPVDRAYVSIQHATGRGWRPVTDDLGLQILWSADARGNYTAQWEVPLSGAAGTYRFVVTAKQYGLRSKPFAVAPSTSLAPAGAGPVVRLGYPAAVTNVDLTYRPPYSSGGSITFLVDGQQLKVWTRATEFPIPAGTTVSIPAGGAKDPYGNTNAEAVVLR